MQSEAYVTVNMQLLRAIDIISAHVWKCTSLILSFFPVLMIFDSDQISDACIKQHIYEWIWPIETVNVMIKGRNFIKPPNVGGPISTGQRFKKGETI